MSSGSNISRKRYQPISAKLLQEEPRVHSEERPIPSFAPHSSKVCQATEAAHFASSSIWLTGNGNESAAGDTAICRRDCLPLTLHSTSTSTLLLKCDSEATKDTLALVCSDASEATGYLITHDIPFRRGSGMVRVEIQSELKSNVNPIHVCEVS